MTNEAFIYDAIRTPRGKGKKDGALHSVKPVSLLSGTLNALQTRNQLDTTLVDDVLMGCVTPIGDQGGNIAKTALLASNWDECVPGVQLNRFCASGLEAVNSAAMNVRSGWQDLLVAGGVESMSRIQMGGDGGAWAFDPQTNIKSGFVPQGVSADLLATLDEVDRETVDIYAYRSHQKAANAQKNGYFNQSLVPVKDINGLTILDYDETVRTDPSLEDLGKLAPSFSMMGEMGFDSATRKKYHRVLKIEHIHTAGNSSGIVDGAAAVLIGSEAIASKTGIEPRARIVSAASISTDPTLMLAGPAPAARKALAMAGLTVDDIDLFEVNEAFASVVLRFQSEMKVPIDKINVNGGSIAMGHPLGATGAMLIGTLLDELERRQLRYGLCTLCVAEGMGTATIIERV